MYLRPLMPAKVGPDIDRSRVIIKSQNHCSNIYIKGGRVSLPVCLAFAITINKAQGQTLNYVGLCPSAFEDHDSFRNLRNC